MSMLGNLAFAAVDNFLKTEILKWIDSKIGTMAANRLLEMIPNSGRAVPLPVRGRAEVAITRITLRYTGTAMRKTEERTLVIPDQIRVIELDRVIPAKPGATVSEAAGEQPEPLTLEGTLHTAVSAGNIHYGGGMGGLRAVVDRISFELDLKLTVNQK